MDNRWYIWWKENKLFLALFPAVVFLGVSMIFFIVGLKFENPVTLFGLDISLGVAISLSASNTIIQIIGNEQDPDEIGMSLWIMWIGSYILGIGTNVAAILSLLSIENQFLEWAIAVGLGTIIEVSPEKLFVMFLKGFRGFRGFRKQGNQKQNPYPKNQPGKFTFPPVNTRKEEEEEKPFFFHGLNQGKQKSNKPENNYRR